MRVEIPDQYEQNQVPLEDIDKGTDDVVTRTGRWARIREDDDGRYAGLGTDDAAHVMTLFEREFDVVYDRETGDIQPSAESTEDTTNETDDENDADDGDGSSDDAPDEPDEPDADGEGPYDSREARAKWRANQFAEDHWNAAKAAVLEGDADDCLDELEDVDDRESIQDAIETRRAEL